MGEGRWRLGEVVAEGMVWKEWLCGWQRVWKDLVVSKGGRERGVWSEVEIRIGVDGYRIHKKKRMQASIRSEISSTPII